MFRTQPRGTHRAPGPAVIDYRGLAAPVGRGVGGVAIVGAVTATAAFSGAESARALTHSPAGIDAMRGVAPALAPSAPTTTYNNVKLRLGARGAAVKHLQTRLNAHGASLAVDGVFGSATLRAVKNHQSASRIGVDGVVGPKTWNTLNASGSSSSQPKLRQGDRGQAVRTLQTKLNERGASLAVDGSFGPATRTAVRSLQSAAGISVDGVVGPQTWKALNGSTTIGDGGGSDGSFNGQAILNAARAQIGVRYVWGGHSPSGFDCSGLVHYAYNQAGVNLPRKTAKGYALGGKVIPASQAQPGDLVAFTSNNYGHMGIYAGGGKIIDASNSRQRVVERSIWNAPHVFVSYR